MSSLFTYDNFVHALAGSIVSSWRRPYYHSLASWSINSSLFCHLGQRDCDDGILSLRYGQVEITARGQEKS